jgi:hypothetical protein
MSVAAANHTTTSSSCTREWTWAARALALKHGDLLPFTARLVRVEELDKDIWIGTCVDAMSDHWCSQTNNTLTVTAARALVRLGGGGNDCAHAGMPCKYAVLNLADSPDQTLMSPELMHVMDQMDRAVGPILVHCVAGQSRSVAVVACYLITRLHVSADTALTRIAGARGGRVNRGFVRQLREMGG